MTLFEELFWRGFVNQSTFSDPTAIDDEKFTFYFGVDPSADSMTVGNLATAMMIRHFINYGHKAVLLVGGATGMIGDPDGKSEERSLKSPEEIAKNKAGIITEYRRIFAGQDFTIVDNYDWFKGLNYLDFLREVGKHMSMTQLLDREFVQSRIGPGGKGISYAEFSYSLIQGYDFLHLFRTKGVTLQLAGADQWGNSVAGAELIRKLEGKPAHVWTGPLVINASTGKKFGKSEDGAIWLNPDKTSVFDFYQFWLNADDKGVEEYLKVYTLLSKAEIDDIMQEFLDHKPGRAAQKHLAYEVTKIVHGEKAAIDAKEATENLFTKDANAIMPTLELAKGEHDIAELLVMNSFIASRSAVLRLLEQGGIKLNRQKIASHMITIQDGDMLQIGKKQFIRIKAKS
jgi:tyrosyl-tRNA synthetase